MHCIQINHKIKNPKLNTAKTEKNSKKAEFNFRVDLKTLIHETSVCPNFQRYVSETIKRTSSEDFLSVFVEKTEPLGKLFEDYKFVAPEEIKKLIVDARHFGQPNLTEMLAESSICWWSGMRKVIENKCSKCTACMSSGKKLKY